MLSIHTALNPHAGPLGSGPVPSKYLGTLKQALDILKHRVRANLQCNASFEALPFRNNFRSFIDNPYIWINYDSRNVEGECGYVALPAFPMDVVLTQFALRKGRWLTAATIIHELAHLNGAPGDESHEAELRVLECGLHSPNGPYNPDTRG